MEFACFVTLLSLLAIFKVVEELASAGVYFDISEVKNAPLAAVSVLGVYGDVDVVWGCAY